MKKFTSVLMILLIACFVSLGCDTGSGGNGKSDDPRDGVQFTEGWWKYETSISGIQVTYILYTSFGNALRAGTASQEYSSEYFETQRNTLNFWQLRNAVSSSTTLTTVPDNQLPPWAKGTPQDPEEPDDPTVPDYPQDPEEPDDPTVPDDPQDPSQPSFTGIWWVFQGGWYVNGVYYDLYAYYENSVFIKGGTSSYQIPNGQLLISFSTFENATSSWIGPNYQLEDLSRLPSWAY